MAEQLQALGRKTTAGGAPLTATRESLWKDALRRLVRNRAAVVGGAIIVILVLAAVFAPVIAPYTYDGQILKDQNTVPQWILNLFPMMKGYAKINNDYLLGADYVGRDLFSRIVVRSAGILNSSFYWPHHQPDHWRHLRLHFWLFWR